MRADADGDGVGSLSLATAVLNSWSEQQTLTANDGKASDSFGWRTSLSADGNTALVGAPFADVGTVVNQGSATVFVRSGGVWSGQQTLTGPSNRQFGDAVALSGDGNTALVGARSDNSATVFVRVGGVWTQQRRLTGGSMFGRSVSLSFDGHTAVVGADMDNVDGIAKSQPALQLAAYWSAAAFNKPGKEIGG